MKEEVGSIHKRQGIESVWGKRSWDERIAQHMKAHELPYVAKERVLGQEVYIGVNNEVMFDETDYPQGYYKTAYAILRGKTCPIQIILFEANHDPEMTHQGKFQARLNTTLREAISSVEIGLESKFYEK